MSCLGRLFPLSSRTVPAKGSGKEDLVPAPPLAAGISRWASMLGKPGLLEEAGQLVVPTQPASAFVSSLPAAPLAPSRLDEPLTLFL